ncbi:hypothetical protein FGO68_gene1216 [Halteria grandinella]|uniref:Leucine-rich repeat-containing protein 56 n=1 Tax=Halteria grandinella TaxID=5974 RepID=A0A8J8NAH1_HALGN|nr:hypothetical protein FGO68_gene1216 [Halteria grandinella]
MRKQPAMITPLQAGGDQNQPALEHFKRKRKPQLPLLQPIQNMPKLPSPDAEIPEPVSLQTPIIRKQRKKIVQRQEEPQQQQQLDDLHVNVDLNIARDEAPVTPSAQDEFERDDEQNDYEDEDFDLQISSQVANGGLLSNFQEKFEEIIENEEVEDAIELNEKFLAEHLGVKCEELSRLTKIELRVDTSCHNLQVTGEILSSLEYLRMSDSIIMSFRDIGTSFRFVRVLHLARCELKEVQGIQAFINLEELYISHNMIEELFDIGFLENLSVLDIEGNNIKEIQQLYYLKRCKQLQNLNIAHNPVCKDEQYYPQIQQNSPNLLVLDDELILGSKFYENKQDQAKRKAVIKIATPLLESELAQRLLKLGLQEKIIQDYANDSLNAILQDDSDEDILRQALQNLSLETKAARQFYEHDDQNFDFGQTIRSQTPSRSSHFIKMKDGSKRAVTPMMFKTTSNSFYKTSTRKSTSMSRGQTDENDGSVGNQSEEKKKENSKLAILRSRHSKLDDPDIQDINNKGSMPKEIQGLLKDVDAKNHAGKKVIREKLQQHSAISFYSSGIQQAKSIPPQATSVYQSLTSLQSSTANLQFPEQNSDTQQRLYLEASGIKVSERRRVQGDVLRNSMGTTEGINSLSGKGPIRAERIVLKQSDIQFSRSFKVAKE